MRRDLRARVGQKHAHLDSLYRSVASAFTSSTVTMGNGLVRPVR